MGPGNGRPGPAIPPFVGNLPRVRRLCVALLLSGAGLFAGAAEPARDSPPGNPLRVPKVGAPPKVDGVLDDPIWREALVIQVNTEVQPGENIPAPVKTEVFLAYGERGVYVAFRAQDPDPRQIRARYHDRDDIWDDDWVSVTFDTFNDERRALEFYSNPLGVQLDRIEVTGGGGGEAWDAIYDSAGRITPEGFAVEMAIPFSSLRFPKKAGDQVWGFDAVRSYPRGVRHHIGSFPRDRSNNCYLCQALKLVGFAGADPGMNLELDPTVVAARAERRDGFPGGPFVTETSKVDPGLTVRWSPTPNIALNATANPDFSQVEADAAQLDVNTRFALYYPEKRPFFLEGMDYFELPLDVVYTRTMADPAWGAKFTGKVGKGVVGAFTVRDDMTNLIFPSSQFSQSTSLPFKNEATVLRYRHDLGRSSTLGFVGTDREGDGYFNRVVGGDAVLRFSETTTLRLTGLSSRTRYPEATAKGFGQPSGTFSGTAFDLMADHSTRNWEEYVHYQDFSPGFRADLGYFPQVGMTFLDSGVLRTWYHDDPSHWFNQIKTWVGYELTRDADDQRLREVYGTFLQYSGPKQSSFYALAYVGRQSFQGVEFGHNTLQVTGSFQATGDLGLGLGLLYGDQVDYANVRSGTRLRLTPNVNLFAGRHFRLSFAHAYERLWVPEGLLYRAHLSEMRAVYQVNLRAFFRAILQYEDLSSTGRLYREPVPPRRKGLLSQLLFSYKVNPQTALYLGYSDNYLGTQGVALTQTDRAVFFKIGYAWVM